MQVPPLCHLMILRRRRGSTFSKRQNLLSRCYLEFFAHLIHLFYDCSFVSHLFFHDKSQHGNYPSFLAFGNCILCIVAVQILDNELRILTSAVIRCCSRRNPRKLQKVPNGKRKRRIQMHRRSHSQLTLFGLVKITRISKRKAFQWRKQLSEQAKCGRKLTKRQGRWYFYLLKNAWKQFKSRLLPHCNLYISSEIWSKGKGRQREICTRNERICGKRWSWGCSFIIRCI